MQPWRVAQKAHRIPKSNNSNHKHQNNKHKHLPLLLPLLLLLLRILFLVDRWVEAVADAVGCYFRLHRRHTLACSLPLPRLGCPLVWV